MAAVYLVVPVAAAAAAALAGAAAGAAAAAALGAVAAAVALGAAVAVAPGAVVVEVAAVAAVLVVAAVAAVAAALHRLLRGIGPILVDGPPTPSCRKSARTPALPWEPVRGGPWRQCCKATKWATSMEMASLTQW